MPETLSRLLRSRNAMLGLAIVTFLVGLALLAPVLPLRDPVMIDTPVLFTPPGQDYWLGTDSSGRDVISRLIWGAQISLWVSLLSVSLALAVGSTVGIISGYVGGLLDDVVMRIVDIFFAFPAILLALALVAALGASAFNVALAIAIVYAPIFARVSRAPVLSVKEQEYIEAVRSLGAGHSRIVLRHILPNVLAPIIVQITLALSTAILTEAALSFLGLGTQPPAPSWGNMLNEGRRYIELAPWLAIFPGLAIMLAVLGFNLLGDGLRDVLDPRLQKR